MKGGIKRRCYEAEEEDVVIGMEMTRMRWG